MSFPSTKSSWSSGQTITSAWGNALEDKIGVDSSADTNSLDYKVNHIGANDIVLSSGKALKVGSANLAFAAGTASYYLGGAGNLSSTATSSLGMGSAALAAVETNGFNVAVGNQALELVTSGATNTAVGYKALNANVTGIGNIAIGGNAGRYATGSNEFYVNSINRSNTSGDQTKSLLYGVMNATESSQTLTTNAAFTATYGMNIPTGQTYKINNSDIFASPTFTGTVTLPTGLTGVIKATSGVVSASNDITTYVGVATTSVAGKVELAVTSEIDTGTDSTRAMPVDQFVASARNVRYINIRVLDPTTDWSANGTTIVGGDFEIPFTGTITEIGGYVDTAGTTGTGVVDVNKNGTTLMTTNKLSFDSTEKSTRTAATAPTLTTTAVTAGDIITVDIDTNFTTKAKGLSIRLGIRQS